MITPIRRRLPINVQLLYSRRMMVSHLETSRIIGFIGLGNMVRVTVLSAMQTEVNLFSADDAKLLYCT